MELSNRNWQTRKGSFSDRSTFSSDLTSSKDSVLKSPEMSTLCFVVPTSDRARILPSRGHGFFAEAPKEFQAQACMLSLPMKEWLVGSELESPTFRPSDWPEVHLERSWPRGFL